MKTMKSLLTFLLAIGLTNTCLAQSQTITFVSIAPDATQVDRPAPPDTRMSSYTFRGTKGTQYIAVFAADAEPATVVGVGADIDSTSYDGAMKQVTINFSFNDSVVSEDGHRIPADEFQIILDPGGQRDFMPKPRPPGGFPPPPPPGSKIISTTATTECYGPANKVPPSPGQNGPPLEAAGSFMSTNLASWCEIPPNEDNPFFGFKLVAPAGTKGFFKKKISPGLLTLLSQLAGRTLQPESLAIFNGTFEASKSITSTPDGGALIDIEVTFLKTANTVRDSTSSDTLEARTNASTTAVTKSLTTAEEESLSLTPKNSKVTSKKTSFIGFVDDSSLSGQTVSLQKKVGSTYKTIGTATVQSDGSFAKSISSLRVFTGKRTSTIVAQVVSDTTRISRQVSLTNKTSSLRR